MVEPKIVITAGKLFSDSKQLEKKLDKADILIHLRESLSEDFSAMLKQKISELWEGNTELNFRELNLSFAIDCSSVKFEKEDLEQLVKISKENNYFERSSAPSYYLYFKDTEEKSEVCKNLDTFYDFAAAENGMISARAKLYSNMSSTGSSNRSIPEEQSLNQIFDAIKFSASVQATARNNYVASTPFSVSMTTQSHLIQQDYQEQIRDNVLKLVDEQVKKELIRTSTEDADKLFESLKNSISQLVDKRYLADLMSEINISKKSAKSDLTFERLPVTLKEAEEQLFQSQFTKTFKAREERIPKDESSEECRTMLEEKTEIYSLLLRDTQLSLYGLSETSKNLTKKINDKITEIDREIELLRKSIDKELENADYKKEVDAKPIKSFIKIDQRKTAEKIFESVKVYFYREVYEKRVDILRKEKIKEFFLEMEKILSQLNLEISLEDLGLYDYKNREHENVELDFLLKESLQRTGDLKNDYIKAIKLHFEHDFNLSELREMCRQDIQELTSVKNIQNDLLSYLLSMASSKDQGYLENVTKIIKNIAFDLVHQTDKPIRLHTGLGVNWNTYEPTTQTVVYYTKEFEQLLKSLNERIDFHGASVITESDHIFSDVTVYNIKRKDMLLYKAEGEG